MPRQIDHQAAIAYRIAGDIMATTTHRYQELMGTGEVNCADDIGDPGAAGDEPWALIDHAVPDFAGLVVVGIAGAEQRAAQTRLEGFDRAARCWFASLLPWS